MNLHKRNLQALTLVEILVVLGIITILAGLTLLIINPEKQRTRARDAVLQNSIGSLGQTIESFYGLYGYYPDGSAAHVASLRPFVKDEFVLTAGSGEMTITKTGLISGGPITYYLHGGNDVANLPCIDVITNEDAAKWMAWGPGVGTKVITATCSDEPGYGLLID